MKILSFIITFGVNITVAVCLLLFLLLGLNGFSEKDANWGIYLYIALSFFAAILTGLLSAFSVGYLVGKKQLRSWTAALISIGAFIITGVILNFVCLFLGVIMAEIKRVNF